MHWVVSPGDRRSLRVKRAASGRFKGYPFLLGPSLEWNCCSEGLLRAATRTRSTPPVASFVGDLRLVDESGDRAHLVNGVARFMEALSELGVRFRTSLRGGGAVRVSSVPVIRPTQR